jgi:hypothetical protein
MDGSECLPQRLEPPRSAAISSTDGVPTVYQLRRKVVIVGHDSVVTGIER